MSPGRYELAIWPKALLDQKAREKFDAEHGDDPDAVERAYVPVATVDVRAKGSIRVVRLPAAAGY